MHKPRQLYQYLATFTSLLTLMAGGMHYAWPSPSLPQLTSTNQITNDEGSWIVIMELIGAIPSCFLGSVITDVIGRKKTILLTAVPYFIAWVVIACARSFTALCAARFLVGISDGIAFTAVPLYIPEISDPSIRGFLGTSMSGSWICGIMLINVIGSYFTITNTAIISSVLIILFLVTFVWMPESPYSLLLNDNVEGARAALRKFKGTDNVESQLIQLQDVIKRQSRKGGNALDLVKQKGNRKALGVMAIVRSSQQMGGTAAISFYTLSIFNEAGDFLSPFTATVVYVSLQFLTSAVCSAVIDKTGRRPLLILSLLGAAISLLVEGSYFYVRDFTDIDTSTFNFVPVVGLITYVIIFHLGAQPIPLLVQGEIFATDVKALASCLSEVYFCILVSVVSKLFQVLRDGFGIYLPFYVFAVCCVINLIFVILFVPETKGKTLEEIQDSFNAKKTVANHV